MKKNTFGVIVANRGFFPDKLAKQGRLDIIEVLEKNDYGCIVVSEEDTNYGAIETLQEAKICAELFQANKDKIDGIIITHPNFGEEKGILEAVRRAKLDVPVLIQAEPDVMTQMTIADRRDSFCGKISNCNNLRQAGIPYTLTANHTVSVKSDEFLAELDKFAAVCNIVKGLKKGVRFGAIGARPAAFNTVRYSEKILEREGVSIEPIDLSEIFGKIEKLEDNDPGVLAKVDAVKNYVHTGSTPDDKLLRIAKFGYVVDEWIKEMELDAITIQCWTSLEENYGIVPCTIMSMLSNTLIPSACEVDATGLLGMYILQLASGQASALLDWNNNFNNEPNKCVLFHCSNLPTCIMEKPEMKYQQIIAGSVGVENTYGTVEGRIAPAKMTYCRTTTDDTDGVLSVYCGEGEFTDDKLDTFGGYGVMEIPNMQDLMQYICTYGFEHHVAVNPSQTGEAIFEALSTYMGWEVYLHE